jgi:hypothetical protein
MTASSPTAVPPAVSPGGKRPQRLARALRARAGRLRIVMWILMLLLPALIVLILGRR